MVNGNSIAANLATAFFTAAILSAVTLGALSRAGAYHNDSEHVTTDTAHTIQKEESRLSLWRYDYGFTPWLQLGTYHWLWFLRIANLQGKARIYQGYGWTLSVESGFSWINLGTLSNLEKNSNARIVSFPFQAAQTVKLNERFELSFIEAFTYTSLRGEYNADEFEGIAAVSNFQFAATLQWRLSSIAALMLHARWLVFQDTSANATSTIDVDDFTTATIHADLQSDILNFRAWSVVPSIAFSWATFNLRFGLGYGNYNIPLFNLVVPVRTPILEFDMYWRF